MQPCKKSYPELLKDRYVNKPVYPVKTLAFVCRCIKTKTKQILKLYYLELNVIFF